MAARISGSLVTGGTQPSRFSCTTPNFSSESEAGIRWSDIARTSGFGSCDLHQTPRIAAGAGGRAAHHIRVFVLVKQRGAHGGKESAERTERVVHGAGFVAAVHHAIGALGIAALGAVALPFGLAHQLVEGIGVAVLQEVAGFLPAKNVVGGHTPWRAFV